MEQNTLEFTLCQFFEQTPGAFRRTLETGQRAPFNAFRDVGGLIVKAGAVVVLDDDPGAGGRAVEVVGVGELINLNEWQQSMPGSLGNVQAIADTVLVGIDTAAWERRIEDGTAFAGLVTEVKARQYQRLLERSAAMRLEDPVRRMAAILAQLGNVAGSQCHHSAGCHVSITQDGIATIAGISRQTANRILSQFKGNRLVHVERGFLCVLDLDGLRKVYSGGHVGEGRAVSFRCKTRNPSICLECSPSDSELVAQAS
ncbi:MAG: Crp/Fnr family transcriptional regulator [Gemmatimonadota bacterium]|nr:Crp/Fnr family transcriptional regulator [Gemmatimonadota bacterium]MDH5804700.1 Crp/Fnr family transcriptional regulator [Gemmatimonadota bacterium]